MKITVEEPEGDLRFDSLYALVSSCSGSFLELSFMTPYDHESDYPFKENQKIEVLTDHQGMGVSVHAIFEKHCNDTKIRINLSGDLCYFNRRRNHRVELDLWVGFEESALSISTIQERWHHQVKQIKEKKTAPGIADIAKKTVSLSSSGLGFDYAAAVQPGHYFLIYLALDDNSDMLCTAGEVVRCEPAAKTLFNIGVHFDFIEEEDRNRIEQLVNQNKKPVY